MVVCLDLVKSTRSNSTFDTLQKAPPKIYNQSLSLHPNTCKINTCPLSLDSQCLEVGAANGDKTNGLMGEARAVNHVHGFINRPLLLCEAEWPPLHTFMFWMPCGVLMAPSGVCLLWFGGDPGLFFLTADSSQLAVKWFSKKKKQLFDELQSVTFTWAKGFTHSNKGQRHP